MTTQQSFGFNEDAPLWIERVLADLQNVCAVHIGTTLDGGACAICELEESLMAQPTTIHNPYLARVAETDPGVYTALAAEPEPEYGWADAITGLPIDVP
jgi:hypothetical protein